MRKISVLLSVLMAAGLMAACASMYMGGGSLVDPGYKPQQILVTYRNEGTVPPNTEYLLVRTERGEAIYERNTIKDDGALFETRWSDAEGDHFAGWVAMVGLAFEVVVPKDRRKPAKRFVYTTGNWESIKVDGIERPVPRQPKAPDSMLIPK